MEENRNPKPLRKLQPVSRESGQEKNIQEVTERKPKVPETGREPVKRNVKKKKRPETFTDNLSRKLRQSSEIDERVKSSAKQSKKEKSAKALKEERKKDTLTTNSIALFNIIIVLIVFAVGASYLLFLKRDTVSHEENRNLAKFPEFTLESYLNGEYTEGIANYYNDTIPNRSFFKTIISTKLMTLKGRNYGSDGGVELYGTARDHSKDSKPAEQQDTVTQTTMTADDELIPATTTVTTLPDNKNPVAEGEIANDILIVNNRGIMLYGGAWGNELTYADYLNQYKEKLGDKVNVYSLVAPTNVSYYLPENYLDLAGSEKDDIDSLNKALKDVIPVDAYTALLMHKKEDIYSRTDHHWQPLGAYYSAQAFAETAGVDFLDLSEYRKVTLKGYVGTLYGYTQSATLLNNPEDFVYYVPHTKYTVEQFDTSLQNPCPTDLLLDPENFDKSSYYLVFGTDDCIRHLHTGVKNGRKLVIFKDSYGNALLPFLTRSFEDVYLCDIRYLDINAIDLIKQVDATDVLFAMCTYSAVGQNQDYIIQNLQK